MEILSRGRSPRQQHAFAMYLCMKGRKASLLASACKASRQSQMKCTRSCLKCTFGYQEANGICGKRGDPCVKKREAQYTRVWNIPLCKKAGSVPVGLGLLSFPPVAVEMYQVVFGMKLRIARRPWWFFAEGRRGDLHASATYLRMNGCEVFLLAPGSVGFPSIAF